jgi:hypothetical protein
MKSLGRRRIVSREERGVKDIHGKQLDAEEPSVPKKTCALRLGSEPRSMYRPPYYIACNCGPSGKL